MSIGLTGITSSLAATPLTQTKGTDADKVARETADAARATDSERQAESAAGIGETSENSETDERDADGRRLWERRQSAEPSATADQPAEGSPTRSKDPTGASGTILDVNG
jgi:hypothetical protein